MSPCSRPRTGGTPIVVVGGLIGGLILLGAPGVKAEAQSMPQGVALPKVSISTGPPRKTPPRSGALWESRRLSATVDGKATDVEVLHLRGLEGIEAADIPESAKAFLLTHAKTLPEDEVAHYVLNKKQIEAWAKTQSLPETLKEKKEKHRKRGCRSISMECARKGVKHVSKEVSKQAEALRKEAREEWKDVSREVGRGLKMAEGALRKCFADHPIKSGPIRIGSLPIPMKVKAAGPLAKGADGKVGGKANLSFPMRLDDVTIEVSAFIIPCAFAVPQVPIWIRPRSVSFEGVLTVDSALDLELNANGKVTKAIQLMKPAAVDLFRTVVFIHAVPVELDLGIELESQLDIKTDGVAHATLCDVRQRRIRLDFECDGKGCRGEQRELKVDFKPIHNFQLDAQGQASVRPWVFTALSFDVNFGALSARLGPEFYVSAEVRGGARAGSTATRRPVVAAAGLSADLYGGVDIRYLVDFLRPEFAPGKSAAQVLKGRTHLVKTLLASKSVNLPSAAAQASQPDSASARCAK